MYKMYLDKTHSNNNHNLMAFSRPAELALCQKYIDQERRQRQRPTLYLDSGGLLGFCLDRFFTLESV